MQNMSFTDAPGFPILSLMIFIPLLAALTTAFLPNPKQARKVALGGATATVILSLLILLIFNSDFAGIQMAERFSWIPTMGIEYGLGVDGISILMIPMSALMFLAILCVAPESAARPRRWVDVNLLILLAATLGVFAATDAILFFIFFEAALVPGYFLIKLSAVSSDADRAARQYMVVMLFGSLPILAGLVLAGYSISKTTGSLSFDIATMSAAGLPQTTQLIVFIYLMIGFAVKAPMLPMHLWLRSNINSSPASMLAWLLGVKLGTYGFLRLVVPLAPQTSADYAYWIIGLSVAAVAYTGLIALSRRTLRSLLLFSSISHVSLVTAAIFSMSEDGWRGAILLMLNSGIAATGLALCIGLIERRIGTSDLRAMGGFVRSAPRLTAIVFVSGLAFIGVPGTSGFIGEFLSIKGVLDAGWLFALVGVSGVVFGAGSFLVAYQRGFLGPVTAPAIKSASDLQRHEQIFGAVLIVIILMVGLFPGVPEKMTRATVTAQIEQNAAIAKSNKVQHLAVLPKATMVKGE
ncbi:MAG: NuoM family protein [Alphaproteobacteria bacterium]